MLVRTYICDGCGRDVSDGRDDVRHRLVLSADYMLPSDINARSLPRLLDRDHHFCGMQCLDQFMVNHG